MCNVVCVLFGCLLLFIFNRTGSNFTSLLLFETGTDSTLDDSSCDVRGPETGASLRGLTIQELPQEEEASVEAIKASVRMLPK